MTTTTTAVTVTPTTRMPKLGQLMCIPINGKPIFGYCLKNAVRSNYGDSQNGIKPGGVVPGLGIMRGTDRRDYWFKAGEWTCFTAE